MADRRYTLSNLRRAVTEPSLFAREGERVLSRLVFQRTHDPGIDVMSETWDNLLILDACRADSLAALDVIDGEFRTVVSRGSSSREFIEANFAGRRLHDTVLVTANPFVEILSDDVFFEVCYAELFERWDDELKTIPPEAVVDAALRMRERHPNKRLLVHFMQPHAPYIGPTGQELYERYEFGVFNPRVMERQGIDGAHANVREAVRDGPIREAELKQAYAENVRIAADHAKELVDRLDGRSVITADHGEMLGERVLVSKRYGHAPGVYTPELRVVPWLVVESDEPRHVTEGEPSGFARLDDETRETRLEALGYL